MLQRWMMGLMAVLACAAPPVFVMAAAAPKPAAQPAAKAGPASLWIGTWGASPVTPTTVAGPRAPLTATFHNQTLRQVVRISAGGKQVRIRLSNVYGTAPLRIGAARIALAGVGAGAGGAIAPGTDHELHFSQHPGTVIPPGAVVLSDPVDMAVAPLSSLSVSIFLPGDTGLCTCHQTGAATGYASGDGDFTKAEAFPAKSTFLYRAYLSGVEVNTALPASAIVVLGDSISDGAVSTPDANHRWPDRLAERLDGAGAKTAWGVVNAGISGNRLLLDGTGQNGLARFDRDVLAVPGVRYLVLLLGVNDLGQAFGPAVSPPSTLDPEDLISGYRQIIARAHAHGIKVYGATVTPYEGAAYWSPKGDAAREDLNSWMRVAGAFDALIDFDAVWRDPAHPARIKPGYGAPDHLHGSDAGYKALGDAVPLALFK